MKVNVILLFGIFVLGCGNGSSELKSSGEFLPPEFDLTGNWTITEIDCNAVGNVEGEIIALEGIASVVEQEALNNPETTFVQDGNSLKFTDLTSGKQYTGTISGDRISYYSSELLHMAGIRMNIRADIEGTVIDANNISETATVNVITTYQTQDADLTFICNSKSRRNS